MTSGTRLRITRSTIALDLIAGKGTLLTIPAEAVLIVLPGLAARTSMVKVLWENRPVEMFTVDLAARGTEIKNRSASA